MEISLLPIWEAFIRLHNRRQIGFQANPIPGSEITDHLDAEGFRDPGIRKWIRDLIITLDDFWISKINAPRKPKKKKGK